MLIQNGTQGLQEVGGVGVDTYISHPVVLHLYVVFSVKPLPYLTMSWSIHPNEFVFSSLSVFSLLFLFPLILGLYRILGTVLTSIPKNVHFRYPLEMSHNFSPRP